MTRIDVVRTALAAVSGRAYLEIGVRGGECFDAIDAETKVAVDPAFTFRPPVAANVRRLLRRKVGSFYFRSTSEDFFARHARRFPPFDVVFVDGLHTYAQSYVDIMCALGVLTDGGVVAVHDCNPASAAAAAATHDEAKQTPGFIGDWNGDVFKALIRVRTHTDLRACVLDCDQGVGIVRRGAPAKRLEMAEPEIEQLDYDAFAAHRVDLLDLRPTGRLAESLGPDG